MITTILIDCSCNSNVYDQIISNQQSTYNTLISVFIALVALFAGATWLYYWKIQKKEVEQTVAEIFQKEKKDFLEKQKLEFKNEIYHLRGESARLFALLNGNMLTKDKNEQYVTCKCNLVYWWKEVFVNHSLSANRNGERLGMTMALDHLKSIVDDKLEIQFYNKYISIYIYQELYDAFEFIDSILSVEKTEIFALLKQIEDAAKKSQDVNNIL